MAKNKKRKNCKEHTNIQNLRQSPIRTRSLTKNNTQNGNIDPTKQENCINMAEPNLNALLQHLPNYDHKNESNIEFYMSQWNALADKCKNITDDIKLILLKAKFVGDARETIVNSPELKEELSYEEFKNKILNEFKTKRTFEDMQNSFLTLKQQPKQSMAEFIKIFNRAATKYIEASGFSNEQGAKNFLETVKFTRFLEAIRADIALDIRKTGINKYEDAAKKALTLEHAYNSVNHELINNISAEVNAVSQKDSKASAKTNPMEETLRTISKNHADEVLQLKNEIKELKLKCAEKQNNSQIKCDICSRANHQTKDCFYNAKSKAFNAKRFNSNMGRNFPQYTPMNAVQSQQYMPNRPIYPDNPNMMYNNFGYSNIRPDQNYGKYQTYPHMQNYNPHMGPNNSSMEMGIQGPNPYHQMSNNQIHPDYRNQNNGTYRQNNRGHFQKQKSYNKPNSYNNKKFQGNK